MRDLDLQLECQHLSNHLSVLSQKASISMFWSSAKCHTHTVELVRCLNHGQQATMSSSANSLASDVRFFLSYCVFDGTAFSIMPVQFILSQNDESMNCLFYPLWSFIHYAVLSTMLFNVLCTVLYTVLCTILCVWHVT